MSETLSHRRGRDALDAILHRVDRTLGTVEDFPLLVDPETGTWDTTSDGNWCGGHWIGLLWLAHRHRGRQRFADAALRYLERMVEAEDLLDSMFAGMNYHYAGFRGYDTTGDRDLFGAGLTGADAMVDLYHPAARMIPIGAYEIEGPEEEFDLSEAAGDRPSGAHITAVDMVYTSLVVLWRAYRETGDPTFRDVAISHADRHLDWCVEPDGSTVQEVIFDPESGDVIRRFNGLAYSDDTCWARGQGWNIAGLARAVTETGAERYIDALDRTVRYYADRSPEDLIPYWDFEHPDIPDVERDTSAAALAAYGLTRLEGEDERIERCRRIGHRILSTLVEEYLVTDPTDERYGSLQHGTYDHPGGYGVDTELIWSTYYLAEALSHRLEAMGIHG